MPITYTTQITGLRARTEGSFTDVVRIVDFVVTGVDSEDSAQCSMPSSMELLGPLEPSTFTPLELLTEAQVLAWLEERPDVLSAIRETIERKIRQQQEQSRLSPRGLPWLPSLPVGDVSVSAVSIPP